MLYTVLLNSLYEWLFHADRRSFISVRLIRAECVKKNFNGKHTTKTSLLCCAAVHKWHAIFPAMVKVATGFFRWIIPMLFSTRNSVATVSEISCLWKVLLLGLFFSKAQASWRFLERTKCQQMRQLVFAYPHSTFAPFTSLCCTYLSTTVFSHTFSVHSLSKLIKHFFFLHYFRHVFGQLTALDASALEETHRCWDAAAALTAVPNHARFCSPQQERSNFSCPHPPLRSPPATTILAALPPCD